MGIYNQLNIKKVRNVTVELIANSVLLLNLRCLWSSSVSSSFAHCSFIFVVGFVERWTFSHSFSKALEPLGNRSAFGCGGGGGGLGACLMTNV